LRLESQSLSLRQAVGGAMGVPGTNVSTLPIRRFSGRDPDPRAKTSFVISATMSMQFASHQQRIIEVFGFRLLLVRDSEQQARPNHANPFFDRLLNAMTQNLIATGAPSPPPG
jgi:hypothetical protein